MSGQGDINATRVVVASSKKITCLLDLSSASPGAWNVHVTNPDGQRGTLTSGFTVLTPLPTISSITPDNAGSGNPSVSAEVAGTNFVTGAHVKLTRSGQDDIDASDEAVASPGRITCSLDLSGARLGRWNVVVTNPDGGSATLRNGFTVNFAPRVRSIRPDHGGSGNPGLYIIRIAGSHFAPGASVLLTRAGCPDIQASDVQVPYASTIHCTLDLSDAALGAWDVHVINPDGGRGVLAGGFTVTTEPTILSITPDNAGSGNSSVASVIAGAGFSPGATVKLTMGGRTIQASTLDVVSPLEISCTFDLTNAAYGSWDVHVTNPDGGTAVLVNGFKVNRAPRVTYVSPNSAPSGKASVSLTVTGTRFAPGAGVRLARTGQSDIIASGVTVVSSTSITCSLDLTNAEPGAWDVIVTNPDGGKGVLAGGFNVTEGPTVISITPNSARTGTTVSVTDLAGTNFASGASVKLTREGQPVIEATDVTVVSPERITCTIDLTGASAGAWNVIVTNPDGGSGSLGGGFTVDSLPAPIVSSIVPDYANSDEGTIPATVTGADFVSGASLRLAMSGQPDINATDVLVVSSTEITCTLDISSAASGAWDVVVTNPDGQSGALTAGFIVNPEPTITSITPDNAGKGALEVRVTINGTHLDHATSVKLSREGQPDITASNLAILSPTELSCLLDLESAEPGAFDVVITNAYGGVGTLPGGFTVNPPPAVSSINPSEGVTGEILEVEIGGDNLASGASVRFTREGQTDITATEVTVVSPTQITCTLDLIEAETGSWNVVVVNPDGGTGTLTDGFNVLTAQTLTSIVVTPSQATIDHGSTLQFTARGLDQSGGELPITPEWSCDPEVGEIDQTGLFTASGYGTCEVTATVGTISNYALVQVPSYIGGTYNEDLTLEKKYNPWILTHDLHMYATLRVEPGVVIKAMPDSRPTIFVYGFLDAQGTDQEPVKITSYKDDSIFGDTNNDGFSEGARGDWGGITFLNNAQAPSLAYVYSYYARTAYNNYSSGSPVLTNCKGNDTEWYGFLTYGGTPQVSDCAFDNGRYGVYVCNASSINMAGCAISDMSSEGFFTDTTPPFTVDGNTFERCEYGIYIADCVLSSTITNNTINNSTNVAIHLGVSAPENVRHNKGRGNAVNGIRVAGRYSSDVTWNATNYDPATGNGLPWVLDTVGGGGPTNPSWALIVDSTLTIEPGAVVKTREAGEMGWVIEGRLVTQGTAENPVTITSVKDDSIWGDTYNDGPYQGDLKNDSPGITVGWQNGTNTMDLNHTTFRCLTYGYIQNGLSGYEHTVNSAVFQKCGYAFNIRSGDATIGDPNATDHNSVVVEDCEDGGWLAGAVGSMCRITHSTIRNQSGSGLMIEAMSGGVCIDNSTMDNCVTAGISSDPGYMPTSLSITDNIINNCGRAIVLFNLPSENVRDNHGTGNEVNGISVGGTYPVDTTWNSTNVGLPYVLDLTAGNANVTVPANKTLTVEAGSVLKGGDSREICAQGILRVNGTPEQRVVFTSLRDDTIWGETTPEQTPPASGDWTGIEVSGGTLDLQNLDHRYAASGIVLHGGEAASNINACTLSNCGLGVISYTGTTNITESTFDTTVVGPWAVGTADVHVSGCTIRNMQQEGIRASDNSSGDLECGSNRISNCGADGISVATTGTVTLDRNTIENCVNTGINISSCGGGSGISSNNISACEQGIVADGCQSVTTIAHNAVEASTVRAGFIGTLENINFFDNGGSNNMWNGFVLKNEWTGGSTTLHLRLNRSPFLLVGHNLTMAEDSVLWIDPGVTLKCENSGIYFIGNARMECAGNPTGDPEVKYSTIITSIYDDLAGVPVIQDDLTHLPSYRDWAGISFNTPDQDQSSIVGTYLGYGGGDVGPDSGLVRCRSGALSLTPIQVVNGISLFGFGRSPGGCGVALNGTSVAGLDGCDFSFCSLAVRCDYTDNPGGGFPTIQNCTFTGCEQGLSISNHNLPQRDARLNATYNDWGSASGPSSEQSQWGGHGCGVVVQPLPDDKDVQDWVKVIPWDGIDQHDPDDGFLNPPSSDKPEVGVIWQGDFEGVWPTLYFSDDDVHGLRDGLSSGTWDKTFDRGDGKAGERDIRSMSIPSLSEGGDDALYLNNVDLAMINSHSSAANISFNSLKQSEWCDWLDLRLGAPDLEWLIIDGCGVLNQPDWWESIIAQGVHIVASYYGDLEAAVNTGGYFAEYATRQFESLSIRDAFAQAVEDDHANQHIPAFIVGGGHFDDYLWGIGSLDEQRAQAEDPDGGYSVTWDITEGPPLVYSIVITPTGSEIVGNVYRISLRADYFRAEPTLTGPLFDMPFSEGDYLKSSGSAHVEYHWRIINADGTDARLILSDQREQVLEVPVEQAPGAEIEIGLRPHGLNNPPEGKIVIR
jgi:parallel beta-helix repeat protein